MTMQRHRGRCGLIGVVLTGLALVVTVTAGSALAAGRDGWGPGGVNCRTETVPVGLAADQPASYHVSGLLCATRRELARGATVQFLVPGATYGHAYWEFGTVGGRSYDYASTVAAAG